MRLSPELTAKCLALAGEKPARQKPVEASSPASVRLTLTLPVKVISEANDRSHWAERNRRRAVQDDAVSLALAGWSAITATLGFRLRNGRPVSVSFTRLGGRGLDKDDNLPMAFKWVRDAIAREIGVDDGHEGYRWSYSQEPGGPVGIRIVLEG